MTFFFFKVEIIFLSNTFRYRFISDFQKKITLFSAHKIPKFGHFLSDFRQNKVPILGNCQLIFVDENNINIVINTVIDYDMCGYVLAGTFVSCWSYFPLRGTFSMDF